MINIAIIGLGRIFKKHLNAIIKNKNFRLVAVCDIDQKKLNQITFPNIKKYKSIQNMLSRENLDMISVLTPSGYHLKNFLDISEHVRYVLIEKPLTTSLKDARKIYNLAKKNKNKVFVVMQNRFNKPILELRNFLKKKKLGKIFLSTIRVRWSRNENYYSLAKWRGTKKYDGGILFNQAAHHIDMMRWLNGPILKISAFKNNLVVKNIEHEDTFVASILFKNKSIGSLEVTVGTRPKDLEGSISFLGTKGSVEISGFSMDEVRHWEFKQKEKKPNFKKHNHIYGNGHIRLYSEVFKAIYNKKNICPTLEDGIENVKLIEKFYKSIRK